MSEERIVLDLFSGTGSATKSFEESDNWKVVRVEKDDEIVDEYGAEIHADILDLSIEDLPDEVDFIWASPPCTSFSRASVGYHWSEGMLPDTEYCLENIRLVWKTLYIINKLDPQYWFLENPQGMLVNIIPHKPKKVTYCQYGDDRMKPTYLFGEHPDSMIYKSCSEGDSCHDRAPRGSNHSGTQDQGMDSVERARVPYGLSEAIKKAIENPCRNTLKEVTKKSTDEARDDE